METGDAANAEDGDGPSEHRTLDSASTTRNRRNPADVAEPDTVRPLSLRRVGWVRLQERGHYELCNYQVTTKYGGRWFSRDCNGKLGYYTDELEVIRCELNKEHAYAWG